MDARQEILINQKVAEQVRSALLNHRIDATQIGETVNFLARIIGGIHSAVLPLKSISEVLEIIKEEVEYGMEMGIPEEESHGG